MLEGSATCHLQRLDGNPLYDEYVRYGERDIVERMRARDELCRQYAWAVPTDSVIAALAKYSPIVEMGAGRGYWAAMLQRAGADVVAYDQYPPHLLANAYVADDPGAAIYTDVLSGSPLSLRHHGDRTLLLCWPPSSTSMAHECLQVYRGNRVIYVGEWYGLTADDTFHSTLEADFAVVSTLHIPQWTAIHDVVMIWERKKT